MNLEPHCPGSREGEKDVGELTLTAQQPLLNIASLGRGHRPLTPAQRAHISRTVGYSPEVVVKVSGGARSLRGVQSHFAYVGRDGDLAVELDDGSRVRGKDFQKAIVDDWNLELELYRPPDHYSIRGLRKPPKLVHNLIFSMPPGTSLRRLEKAVRNFAANEFALQHRYAFVMHTDEPHPHVHMVVKAVSERGERLNIRKATLRHWRQQFAEKLREQGVPANATERAVRGQSRMWRSDRVFRVSRRGASWFTHSRDGQHRGSGGPENSTRDEQSRLKAERSRAGIVRAWQEVAMVLEISGDAALADRVRRFARRMPILGSWWDQSAVRANETRPAMLREPLDRTR